MTHIRMLAAVSVLALALSACGALNDDGSDGSGSGGTIDHPTGAGDLVLRWEYTGGFIPYEYALKRVPSWSLFGDGSVVVEGPQIEIYPGPAMPNLLVTRLSEGGVQAILAAAKDAGLMDGDHTYDYPCITDVPTTVFTTNADGRTSVVSAYALGDATAGSCPNVDDASRKLLYDFQTKLGDLASWLPEGSIGAEAAYTPSEVRIYVLPYQADPELPQQAIEWPLATGLKSFGESTPGGVQDGRCGTVSGADLDALRADLQAANELTPWSSEGTGYRLLLRPLLPDEHGC